MTESKRKGLKDLAYHVANGLFLPVENFFECFTWECITCDIELIMQARAEEGRLHRESVVGGLIYLFGGRKLDNNYVNQFLTFDARKSAIDSELHNSLSRRAEYHPRFS